MNVARGTRARVGITASLAFCALLSGCRDAPGADAPDRETLTRRQRDSVISTLPLPGAAGVGGALRASDAMGERSARHDSLLAVP